jgi:hypothetical protein
LKKKRQNPRMPFMKELEALGAPRALTTRLRLFLISRHPGEQERIYHCLAHSCEVAGLTARLLRSWPRVPRGRKVLLILSAAVHDVDPHRKPGTPARVAATIEHLENDPEARALLRDFGELFDFTPAQVCALILATDYSPFPEEMKAKRANFVRASQGVFGDDPWIPEWGRRLAYWDQISTYLDSTEKARRRVAGLARELRATKRRPLGMSDISGRFLAALRRDPLFEYLPLEDRRRFDAALASFVKASRPVPA